MNALYQKLAEIDVKLYTEEKKRNDLYEDLRQGKFCVKSNKRFTNLSRS